MSAQDSELMELGGKFIKAFHHMIHTVRIHQENNQLMKECIAQFGKILAQMAGGEELEMSALAGKVFSAGRKASVPERDLSTDQRNDGVLSATRTPGTTIPSYLQEGFIQRFHYLCKASR